MKKCYWKIHKMVSPLVTLLKSGTQSEDGSGLESAKNAQPNAPVDQSIPLLEAVQKQDQSTQVYSLTGSAVAAASNRR